MKDNGGSIYWPEFAFNGIGDFIPGQGYQIKMFQAETIVFPSDKLKDDASLIEEIESGLTSNDFVKNELQL